jgi:hypothetical protein
MLGTYTLVKRSDSCAEIFFKAGGEMYQKDQPESVALVTSLNTDSPEIMFSPIFVLGMKMELIHTVSDLIRAEKSS